MSEVPEEPEKEASTAVDRLHEVTGRMRALWRRSMDEKEPGGRIDLYVADTDVVLMFMRPAQLHNYGALLRYDKLARGSADSATANSLNALEKQTVEFLGKLLFFQLNPAVPVAILPAHEVELEYKLADIAAEAVPALERWPVITAALVEEARENHRRSCEALLSARSALPHDTDNSEESAIRIADLLNVILDGFRGDDAMAQLFRFNMLMANDRLRHIDRIALRNGAGQSVYLPAPTDAEGQPIASVATLERRLGKMMTETYLRQRRRPVTQKERESRGARARQRAIDSDARALAHLAWLNEQLDETEYFVEVNGANRRVGKLVLISGSQRIAHAVEELELTELQRVIFVPLALLGHEMMDDYLRGTAPEPAQSGNEALKSSLMINFLDSMQQSLSRAAEEGAQTPIVHALNKARKDHVRVVESWQGRELISRDGAPDPVTEALNSLERAGTSFTALGEFVNDLAIRAWQTFARSVAFFNYKNADARGLQRNIPPVCFDRLRYEVADQQARELRNFAFRHAGNAGHAGQPGEGPLNIHLLNREDPSHYTEFMCYALWNLGHRMMRLAQGCAEQALSIAEEAGRERIAERCEALFLRAHLMKLCAATPGDLDRARRSIQEIDQLLDGAAPMPDAQTGPVPFDAAFGASQLRFAAEDFSITCHRYYFNVLRPVPARYDGTAVLAIFERGVALLPLLPPADGGTPRDYVSEYARQQILGNLVQLALLVKFGHSVDDGKFSVYSPLEPPPEASFIEERVKPLVSALIEVCTFLRDDPRPGLPRASLLSASLAAAAADVWLNRSDLAHWFNTADTHSPAIDQQRVLYLDGVRQRQRR